MGDKTQRLLWYDCKQGFLVFKWYMDADSLRCVLVQHCKYAEGYNVVSSMLNRLF